MADDVISFDEIPYDRLEPGTFVEVKPSYMNVGALPIPTRVIHLVQKLAAGSAVAAQLYEITRAEEATVLFGAGSIGEDMVAAFKAANKTTRMYAIAASDVGGGTAATGKFVYTGTGGGEVDLYIDGLRIPVSLATGTAADWAAASVIAINAIAGVHVAALQGSGGATNEVLLTAKHKGLCGNDIDLRVNRFADEIMPAGLTVAVTAMANGASNPDVQPLLDAITNEWFTDIVMAWDDSANLVKLAAVLKARYKAMGKKDAHAYVGHKGTYGGLGTKGAITNSQFLTPVGANKAPSPPWVWAAALAAVCSFQLTNDPARQLRGLELVGVVGPDGPQQFTDEEKDLLLRQGISTFTVLSDGTVVLDRVITAYKTSQLGALDRAWLDIWVPKTATRVRYDWATFVTLQYPRHKLADDDSPAAASSDIVATPRRMHGSWGARCKIYERNGWITDVKRTVNASRFVRPDSDRNRLNGRQFIRIMDNLIVLAGSLEFEA